MALVFRSDQTTPLTNNQLDDNFRYLRDGTLLKYSIADFNIVAHSDIAPNRKDDPGQFFN